LPFLHRNFLDVDVLSYAQNIERFVGMANYPHEMRNGPDGSSPPEKDGERE